MNLRRICQAVSLALFLGLLVATAWPLVPGLRPDIFVRLDPGLFLAASLAGKVLLWAGLPALGVLAATVLLGRVFCSHVCPLGTTLDMAHWAVRPRGKKSALPAEVWRKGKYLFFLIVLVAAAYGLNLAFWGAPLSLAPRLYGLVLFPALRELADPAAVALFGIPLAGPRFALVLFHLLFFGAMFALLRWAPRFWCRFLCPTGAVLALCANPSRSLHRRRVSEACTACGACVRRCPMGAIPDEDPKATRERECIGCRTCVAVCPEQAVAFSGRTAAPKPAPAVDLGRREAVGAVAVGLGAVAAARVGLYEFRGEAAFGEPMPENLLRPPGALPEADFLAVCLRCGLCMKACPSNMLQPAGAGLGFAALFSPLAVPRRGACEALCWACGAVCPSGALRPLDKREKPWAKLGTAVVRQNKCLAWEQDLACLVCDEACPYDAISLEKRPGKKAGVPVVNAKRCAGCGFCENKCPVKAEAAIYVTPLGAQRLAAGSFESIGRAAGLDIVRANERQPPAPEHFEGAPPGFDE
jgi:MauM/NapG family ferredoxin protein